jgi:hypothetical protein
MMRDVTFVDDLFDLVEDLPAFTLNFSVRVFVFGLSTVSL